MFPFIFQGNVIPFFKDCKRYRQFRSYLAIYVYHYPNIVIINDDSVDEFKPNLSGVIFAFFQRFMISGCRASDLLCVELREVDDTFFRDLPFVRQFSTLTFFGCNDFCVIYAQSAVVFTLHFLTALLYIVIDCFDTGIYPFKGFFEFVVFPNIERPDKFAKSIQRFPVE